MAASVRTSLERELGRGHDFNNVEGSPASVEADHVQLCESLRISDDNNDDNHDDDDDDVGRGDESKTSRRDAHTTAWRQPVL